jgi:hypothetical protein
MLDMLTILTTAVWYVVYDENCKFVSHSEPLIARCRLVYGTYESAAGKVGKAESMASHRES